MARPAGEAADQRGGDLRQGAGEHRARPHLPAAIAVSAANLRAIMRLNETTLIEITLRRNVREGVFRLARGVDTRGRFDDDKPGPII